MTAFSAALLALIGWCAPQALARVFPEGVRPLLVLGAVATVLVAVLAAAVFACLYWWQGMPFSALSEAGVTAVVFHFGRLSMSSAIVWAPVLILSVANLPRHWVTEKW